MPVPLHPVEPKTLTRGGSPDSGPEAAPAGSGTGALAPASAQAARHQAMCRELLRAHPQARALVGSDPRGALALPLLLALHWGLAWAVAQGAAAWGVGGGLALAFMAAFFVGQVLLHAAGALLHETAHRLVFRAAGPKRLFDLGLELMLASFGRQLTYQHEHVTSHHRHMGDYERDYEHEDVCALLARNTWQARSPGGQRAVTIATVLLHLLPFGFLIGERLLPWFYGRVTGRRARDAARRIPATQPTAGERRLFIAVSLLANVGLWLTLGFWAWLYHNWALSIFLGKAGVTNLGQSLAEHPGDDAQQPTRSYYGWMNRILFNTGYHNEHHTLPSVPWTRLPALRRMAPELFTAEAPYGYVRHWWEHVRHDFRTSRRNPMIATDLSGRCPALRPAGPTP